MPQSEWNNFGCPPLSGCEDGLQRLAAQAFCRENRNGETYVCLLVNNIGVRSRLAAEALPDDAQIQNTGYLNCR